MKSLTALTALTALTILTACDRAGRADFQRERADALYGEAMEDYRAGRMEDAIRGFQKAVRKDPTNASARFQLACLLQDVRQDYAAACCCYQEYLLQHPESDKASLAADRLALCEKELAKVLSERFGLNNTATIAQTLDSVRREQDEILAQKAAAEKEIEDLRRRIQGLVAERERLLAMVKGGLMDNPEEDRAAKKDALDLLEEDDLSASSALLPERKPEDLLAKTNRNVRADSSAAKAPANPRPPTYVIKDGDTLYGIAKRFYGTISAWKLIREANKAKISTDSRLRVGETITLP